MEKYTSNSTEEKNYILEKETNLFTGKYFRLSSKKYCLEKDSTRCIEWECVYRNNIENFKKIYGAEIIALIRNSVEHEDEKNKQENQIDNISIILIENYRFPVDKKILEFPAGLIENSDYGILEELHNKIESTSDAELKTRLIAEFDSEMREITINSGTRELKEETGYSGTFKAFFTLPNSNPTKIFQNVFYDPWKGLENSALCIFEIDKSSEENLNPVQNLDECEVIKVHEVKLSQLINFITEKIEKENYGCSSHVYSFAMGLQFSNLLNGIFKK
jgi:8-oxo-dGTP pyrophosphatase MutT (NUDIX family)